MAWGAAISVAIKAYPMLAKHLPRVSVMLRDPKVRAQLTEAAKEMGNQSPTRKLKGRIDVTAALADGWAKRAESEADRAKAAVWSKKARKLSLRCDMPITGTVQRAAHRKAISSELAALQSEINAYLGTKGSKA